MKIWDIVKTVGSEAIQAALPGVGSIIVSSVNALLSDDDKLPAGATGDDINKAIARLPADQQAAVMEKEFDVAITRIKEGNATVRSMLESDARNPHSTRPYIARGAFIVVAFAVLTSVLIWAYGVTTGNVAMAKAVVEGWPFILAAIGPLVTLLWAYFGVLKSEHRDRLSAANGEASTAGGIAGILSNIIKRR